MKSIPDLFELKASFAKLLKTQKLPFRITPQIERYLEDILYLHDEWLINNKDEVPVLYLITNELKNEIVLSSDWENNKVFWKYLRDHRIAIALPHMLAENGFSFAISQYVGMPSPTDSEAWNDFWKHVEDYEQIELPDTWCEHVEKIMLDHSSRRLYAIERTHSKEGPPVVKTFITPQKRQKKLKTDNTIHDAKIDRYSNWFNERSKPSPYAVVIVSEIELIRELYNHIKNKSQVGNEYVKPSVQVIQDSKVRFDSLNGVLRYEDEIVKFHRGERGNKPRLALFKELWEPKKYIKNGKIKAKGEAFPPEALAVRLDIVDGASDFQRNKQKQEHFFGLIKGINRQLRDKNIPARIERNNGIQLVITEK